MSDRPAAVFIADEQLDQIAIRVAKRTLSELSDLIDRGGGLRISDHDKQEIADLVVSKLQPSEPETSETPAPVYLSEEDKDDIAERVAVVLGALGPDGEGGAPKPFVPMPEGGTTDDIDLAKHEQTK